MKYDLHSHSNFSDGSLSPEDLISRAKLLNVQTLAITDHDTVAAYNTLSENSLTNLTLIPGIEFSTQWRNYSIHIVGLNINLEEPQLHEAIEQHKQARSERAKQIIQRLNKKLKSNLLFSELEDFSYKENICRPHIANYLIERDIVKNRKEAFDKYLGKNKLGDVKPNWLSLDKIINIIRASHGVAVLAHPLKYKFTRTKLLELFDEFKSNGGQAVEAISGRQQPQVTIDLLKMIEIKKLYASIGSDFHEPGLSWAELGQMGKLPENCQPVWELF